MSRTLILSMLVVALVVTGCGPDAVSGITGAFRIRSIETMETGAAMIAGYNLDFRLCTMDKELAQQITKSYKEAPESWYIAEWRAVRRNDPEYDGHNSTKCGYGNVVITSMRTTQKPTTQ